MPVAGGRNVATHGLAPRNTLAPQSPTNPAGPCAAPKPFRDGVDGAQALQARKSYNRKNLVKQIDSEAVAEAAEATRAEMQGRRATLQGNFHAVINELLELKKANAGIRKYDVKLWGLRLPTVIHPNSAARGAFDTLSLVLLIYTGIFTPYQIAFLSETHTMRNIPDWTFAFALDRLVDVVFTVDLLLNFRSAYVGAYGHVVFNQREVAKQYLKSWFVLDFLSILPWDVLVLLAHDDTSSRFRLPKLLRLFRLMKIAKVLRASRIFKRWESKVSIKFGVVRLAKFAMMIMAIAHWFACMYFIVGTMGEEGSPRWLTKMSESTGRDYWNANPYTQYTVALYWAIMTLVSDELSSA